MLVPPHPLQAMAQTMNALGLLALGEKGDTVEKKESVLLHQLQRADQLVAPTTSVGDARRPATP